MENTSPTVDLNKLFNIVRSEDAVLWVGAGFSRYAGYKNGSEFAKLLAKKLSEEERKDLDISNLSNVSQAVVNFNQELGSKIIINCIKNEFINKKARENHLHKTLAKIPHFKTIITTNYDRLIEKEFGDKAEVILNDFDVNKINKNKTQIVKIHGDPSVPDSIVITQSDYLAFFSQNKQELNIWNLIKERISTKSQIFLGFNLEDIDVTTQLNKIFENLKGTGKPHFFIAPDQPPYKIEDLKRKNINYINQTSEKFIPLLYQNIADNSVMDYRKGLVSKDTIDKLISNHELHAVLETGNSSIRLISNEKPINLKLTFDVPKNQVGKLNDFLNRETLNEIEIQVSNFSKKANNLTLSKNENNVILKFSPKPIIKSRADIKFENTDFSLKELPISVWFSKNMAKLEIELPSGKFITKSSILDEGKVNATFQIIRDKKNKRPHLELQIQELLFNIFSGHKYSIVLDKFSLSNAVDQNLEELERVKIGIEIFNMLIKIEDYFKVKFNNYVLLEKDLLTIEYLYKVSKGEKVEHYITGENEFSFELDSFIDLNIDNFVNVLKEKNEDLVIHFNKIETIKLFGVKIELGYKIFLVEKVQITNLNEIYSQRAKIIRLKSITKKVYVGYSKKPADFEIRK